MLAQFRCAHPMFGRAGVEARGIARLPQPTGRWMITFEKDLVVDDLGVRHNLRPRQRRRTWDAMRFQLREVGLGRVRRQTLLNDTKPIIDIPVA